MDFNKGLYSEYEFRKIFNERIDDKSLFWEKYNNLIKYNKGKIIELSNCSNNLLYIPKKYKRKNKENIIIFSHELSRTGAPVVAYDAAKVLSNEGYNVLFVSLYNGDILNEILDNGIPVIIMNELKKYQYLKNDISDYTDSIDFDILMKSFDKVLFNTATMYQFIKRYMNDYKNIYWWIHEGPATYNGIGDKMPKYINDNVKVVCVGKYASDTLDNYGFHYKQSILNYGVNDQGIITKRNKHDKLTFLNVGTISDRKGQQLMIDVINELPKKYFNKCQFIFIGDCNENDAYAKNIKNQLLNLSKKNKNISYSKTLPREELYDLYHNIDVLTVTSNDDPMPVVATENFMFGNTVLCSTNTGTSHYLKDTKNGFIFKSGNEKSLKNKLEYIIKHSNDLLKIGESGRNIFEKNFDMNVFKNNILDLITSNEGDCNEK